MRERWYSRIWVIAMTVLLVLVLAYLLGALA